MRIIERVKRLVGYYDILFVDSLGYSVARAVSGYRPKRLFCVSERHADMNSVKRTIDHLKTFMSLEDTGCNNPIYGISDGIKEFLLYCYPFDTYQVLCVGGAEMKIAAERIGLRYMTTEEFIKRYSNEDN